jgi:proteasome lid subunit RPN8/RPN11
MMPTQITLSADDAEAIRTAAAEAFPLECCGLLIGAGAAHVTVQRIAAAANVASDKRAHFEIDPQTQFHWLRASRDGGARIVGHYHSHPNGRATPSAADMAMASDPEAVWLIVAVEEGRAGAVRAFTMTDQTAVEIPVVIPS